MKSIVLLLFIFAGDLSSFADSSPTTWPIGQSFRNLGGPDGGRFHSINAPTSFMEKLPKGLIGNPNSWFIGFVQDWYPIKANTKASWKIAKIHSNETTIVILVGETEWTQLNEPQALPLINSIMQASYVAPQTGQTLSISSMSKEMLEGYVESVITLSIQKPGPFEDLAQRYWEPKTSKERELAKKVCVPSQIVRTSDSTKISTNVLYSDGSIARWTLTLSTANSLNITSIKTEEVYPRGSGEVGIEEQF